MVKSFYIKDDKVRYVFQSDVKERFTLMIPLFSLQKNYKTKYRPKKSIFAVPYDTNDMVIKLLTNRRINMELSTFY